MIHVLAAIQVKEDCKADFVEIFKSNVPLVLEEKGCLAYAPTVDAETDFPIQQRSANTVTIIEQWESLEDLQAHLKAPHMTAYREKVKDMVDQVSLKVLEEA